MIAPPVSQVFLRLLDFFPCEQSYVAKLCQYVRIISKYFHYRKSWTYTYLRMTIYPIDFKAVSFLNIYQTQKNMNPNSTELRRDHWTSASNDFESQPECPAVLVVRRFDTCAHIRAHHTSQYFQPARLGRKGGIVGMSTICRSRSGHS